MKVYVTVYGVERFQAGEEVDSRVFDVEAKEKRTPSEKVRALAHSC